MLRLTPGRLPSSPADLTGKVFPAEGADDWRDAFEKLREWAGGSRLTEEARTAIDAELDEGWALARGYAKRTRKRRAA